MATLLLKGVQEGVYISNTEASKLNTILSDPAIPRDQVINLQNHTFRKGEIKFIAKDPERDNTFLDKTQEYINSYFTNTNQTPREKASKCWGHFTLFYWGAFGKNPEDKMKQVVEEAVLPFFEQNIDRTLPDPGVYVQLLNLSENFTMDANVLRLIERVELNQQDMVELKTTHVKKEDKINEQMDKHEEEFSKQVKELF